MDVQLPWQVYSDKLKIQITGDADPAATNEEALDAPIAIAAEENDPNAAASSYVIQYPDPDNQRQELLEFIENVLIKQSEKYADLAIFCSDGIVWSSKLILASASPFIKDLLSSVPNIDDTCLVLPHMTKVEFLTFQSALFSKDETHQSDMYSVIKGCEMLCIDLEDPMTVLTNTGEDPPVVEYSSILSNPFEKKRVLKSLGYVPMDGFGTDQMAMTDDSDIMKGIGPVLRVLEDNIKCTECDRTFFDTASLERHQKVMHSSYTIDKLIR